jgi:hypothetical protein
MSSRQLSLRGVSEALTIYEIRQRRGGRRGVRRGARELTAKI